MLSQQIFKKIVSASALVAAIASAGYANAQLTIVSFGERTKKVKAKLCSSLQQKPWVLPLRKKPTRVLQT